MPRGKTTPKKVKDETPRGKYSPNPDIESEWGGFINVSVDEATKEEYNRWLEGEGAGFWPILEDIMAEGLKFGLSWDASNSCYVSTLTGCGMVGSNTRFCLSARSGRFEDATALLVFKHDVLAQGDWGNYKPKTRSFMQWG